MLYGEELPNNSSDPDYGLASCIIFNLVTELAGYHMHVMGKCRKSEQRLKHLSVNLHRWYESFRYHYYALSSRIYSEAIRVYP